MDPVQQYAALLIEHAKIKGREIKKMWNRENRAKALPKVPGVYIANNYINPVTLEAPPRKVIVYKVTNRTTKRTNYYDAQTFWRLAGHQRNSLCSTRKRTSSQIPTPAEGSVHAMYSACVSRAPYLTQQLKSKELIDARRKLKTKLIFQNRCMTS